ncbi:MAG: FGGY family carbohydrate kinase, partial [Armatimonadia bacterium]
VGDNGRRGTSPRPTAEVGETPAVRVLAIGISAQGHSWVPTDGGLRPLRKAMTWLDARAEGQARRLLEDHSLEFWGEHAGKQPGQWHLLPQLLWLREHEPETVAAARRYLFAHDYILMRLTGEVVTDYTTAAGSLLFDLQEWGWSSELLAEYGVEEGLLPRIVPAGTVAGKLTAEAAEELGLTGDVVVAVGAQDQKCAALAAGLDGTTATASLGTATAIIARVAEPRFEAQHGLIPCFPFLKPGEWILEAPLATTGGALRWLRDLLGKAGAEGYAEMMVSALEVPPGAEGTVCVPYLAGAGSPHWCGTATGSFHGLTLRTGQGHLTRALLEAVAYDIAANLEHMKALGCRIDRLVLFGGGARSELWPQIVGAVCGVPTYSSVETEAAVRGAAMLAAEALRVEAGVFAIEAAEVRVPEGWAEAYEGLGRLTGAAYGPTQRGRATDG